MLSVHSLMLPMTFNRKVSKGVKLAIVQRLKVILEQEHQAYQHWKDYIAPKMKATRRAQVDRAFKKRLQSYRLVIYYLTPYEMREGDVPTLFHRN